MGRASLCGAPRCPQSRGEVSVGSSRTIRLNRLVLCGMSEEGLYHRLVCASQIDLLGQGAKVDQAQYLEASSEPESTVSARILLVFSLSALGLSGVSVIALARLPYSTSTIVRVSEEAVAKRPEAVSMVGDLTWEYELYRTAPELKAFRSQFGPSCGGVMGVEAAKCVTAIFAQRSPRGAPTVEYVDSSFNPAAALKAHMSGAPGHCTTRSAMVTTALLALGVPTRVVQFLPREGGNGHNVLEVWVERSGWVLFDPLLDSAYMQGDAYLSSTRLVIAEGGLRWLRPHEGAPDPNIFVGSTVHYPEPWLYTRLGTRCARWPFRGCFAQIGPGQFVLGSAQRLALWSAILWGFAALALGLMAWRARARVHE